MSQRLNIQQKGQQALKPLYGIGMYLKDSPVAQGLRDLVNVRVSQINGCAFCLDMHYREARAHGETEKRLYGLSTWRHISGYTVKERAALLWAEAVTRCDVPDSVYDSVARQFSEEELIDLTLIVAAINTWNRINIPFQGTPEDK